MALSISSSLVATNRSKGQLDAVPLLANKNKIECNICNGPIISGFKKFRSILGDNFYRALYVLANLTLCFMIAQISMWLLGVTVKDMQRDQGWGDGDGTGSEYDFLAGPAFAVMSIVATLPVGYIVDKQWISRESFLSFSCLLWSGCTIATGFSSSYWQVLIFRMLIAAAAATPQPLCASIISDFFPSEIKSSAMAIFHFGIYIGYSVAYGVGNWVSQKYSWRYAWFIFGFLGIALALSLWCLPKYRPRATQTAGFVEVDDTERASLVDTPSRVSIRCVLRYYLQTPSLVLLLIASLYRNSGGYIFGYQANNFYMNEKGQSSAEIASYLGWIPAIGGSIGCLLGGSVSDALASKYGRGANNTQFIQSTVTVRIWLLVLASLISGPLAAGAMLLAVPSCYWSLFAMYLFSEMWIAVTVTIVAELSPEHMKSTLLSIYFFVIAFGGLSPQLITPLENVVGYFWAIFILWPGVYTSAALLFFLVIFTYKRDLRKSRRLEK